MPLPPRSVFCSSDVLDVGHQVTGSAVLYTTDITLQLLFSINVEAFLPRLIFLECFSQNNFRFRLKAPVLPRPSLIFKIALPSF